MMLARQRIIEQLRKLGVQPSKERGQNFLLDPGALSELVLFGKPREDEQILEIGPGLGALTAELTMARELILVEIQPEFVRYLTERFPAVKIFSQDIRAFDFSKLPGKWTVFGNLPYSLSSEIILWLIDMHQHIKRSVLLLQKEFAERIFASPGTKDYGSLTLQVQLFADVEPGPLIAGDCFYPPAAVTSQVIAINFLEQARFEVINKQIFDRVVRGAFNQRRKKVLNSIRSSGLIDIELLQGAFEQSGIDPALRAEQIALKEFVVLSNCISMMKDS